MTTLLLFFASNLTGHRFVIRASPKCAARAKSRRPFLKSLGTPAFVDSIVY